MKKIVTVIYLFLFFNNFGQSYIMPSTITTYTTCSGNFYDSGGSASSYLANETSTVTFCPATAGAKMVVSFISFNVENNFEFLYVYDGQSTSSPSLGVYSGTSLATSTLQASVTNTTGCLTFRFTSDPSLNLAGWEANLSCTLPCQTITSVFNSSTPTSGTNNIIKLCQGQSLIVNGSGNFSNSSVGANYTWSFGNGLMVNGTTGTTTYTASGIYYLNLNITDANGCTSSNDINQEVHVSPTPSYSTIVVSDTLICLGDSTTIYGVVPPVLSTATNTYVYGGTTFLPDGSGISYETTINVSSFAAGQTITSASDLQNVLVNMEHS